LSFEIRARKEKNLASSGYQVRFQQLLLTDVAYDLHTIAYQYDLLSRLLSADYVPGSNLNATPFRAYDYTYDRAGNRLSQSLSLNGGAPTVTSYTYNAANQITNAGFTYDNNGNLTSDGANTYTSYDRANRLREVTNGTTTIQYAYDGMGRRVSQTVDSLITRYLLDVQPGLELVIDVTTGSSTDRYVHGPMGIHAMQNNNGDWRWAGQDALGSVRFEADDALAVLGSRNLAPYLTPFDEQGAFELPFVGTGEIRDEIGLQYHRKRYLNPALGVFLSLDPFEGTMQRAMS
jgi:YD repeat-containing protein